ncbi:MAG: hypothetical protein NTX37_12385 [Burkholderiales bacterium]|jgi:hypothetical protein|nr:hypothetical protein [Burkholderiales bacterium]
MSNDKRLDFVNSWPNTALFPAEQAFDELLRNLNGRQCFHPHRFLPTSDREAHITISYLIDALGSLPKRPDHAFDWIWRAMENIVTSYASGNITDCLRVEAAPKILGCLRSDARLHRAFFNLLDKIPYQTCEYLFKQVAAGKPYSVSSKNHAAMSKFGKRLLLRSGSGEITSYPLQFFLTALTTKYDYSNHSQRRNGAALLRLGIQGGLLRIGNAELQLADSDRLFFLLSGLGYSFRNDRAHANSIAPFQSSYASLKTYAHCWFMFLFVYQSLICYLKTISSAVPLDGDTVQNFYENTDSYVALFKREIAQ